MVLPSRWRCSGVSSCGVMQPRCPSRAAPNPSWCSSSSPFLRAAGMRLGNQSPDTLTGAVGSVWGRAGGSGGPGGLGSNPVSLAEVAEPSRPPPRPIPAVPPAEPRPPARPAVPKKEKPPEDDKSSKVLTKSPRAELCGAPEAVTCECSPRWQLRAPPGARALGCCRLISSGAH